MRKGSNAGGVRQLTLEDVVLSAPAPTPVPAPAPAPLAPGQQTLSTYTASLGKQITMPNKSKLAAGAPLTKSVKLLKPDTLEYLYLTNGYIFRGIEQTAAAVVRNGYEVTASNAKDQKVCDEFIRINRLDSRLLNAARNTALFGNGYWEMYDSDDGPRVAELPPAEVDFKRDMNGYILYTADGIPIGYEQKRNNEQLAEWDTNFIAHFKFLELGASDIGISLIQPAVYSCTEYGIIRQNIADSFIRALNVAHIAVEGATPEDLEEVANRMGAQFTAESVYVTSERYKMTNVSNVGNNVDPARFVEPPISEIAAAFSIPVELIASTSTFNLSDFETRYAEWLETIKEKQRLMAEVLETQVFATFLDAPVDVKFNAPNPMDINNLMKNLGFAVQSQAITEAQSQKILEKADVFPEVE
ncbi:hypothetical protein [Bacteroides sp.]|uniref:hypothetical protein n=1 Tax=Bacteroides sp. TaxID=29523 RepID=UPI002604D2A6|nr:hypothetical protein [Bacteroides sp.]MDD3039558.1 hypothetical protein [Bacteroides sp.]